MALGCGEFCKGVVNSDGTWVWSILQGCGEF